MRMLGEDTRTPLPLLGEGMGLMMFAVIRRMVERESRSLRG
jgi:hypothetical protein